MFITKKHLSRRTLLRGAGVSLALPLLDCMIPAAAARSQVAAAFPPRFVAIFYPQGLAPGHWVPETVGPLPLVFPDTAQNHSMSILKPLEPLRDSLVVLSGLWAKSAEHPADSTGSDEFVAAAFLTANKPKKTSGSDRNVGSPSIDQTIARAIGGDSLVPSLQLAVEDPNQSSSSCGQGYSCWYTNTISWSDATTPMPMELDSRAVFQKLFGPGASAAERASRRKQSRSILDDVVTELVSLKTSLAPADRKTIDSFTDQIREVERHIELAEKSYARIPAVDEPDGIPEDYDMHIKLHYDLVSLAFQGGIL